MKRLYFMLPDVQTTRNLVTELREAGVPESHLHVVAAADIPMEGLPEATLLQTSQFARGIEAGLGVGGAAGLLGGLLAVTFPPAGLVVAGEAIIAMALAGASLGAVVSGLVAKDMPKHELEAFEAGIAQGKLLLLVDVPKEEVEQWSDLIRSHYPRAQIGVSRPPKR